MQITALKKQHSFYLDLLLFSFFASPKKETTKGDFIPNAPQE